jgi:hypothetical protein
MTNDNPDKLYPIRDNFEYGIVAGVMDDQQHLIMFSQRDFLDLVFTNEGDMLSAKRHEYSTKVTPKDEQRLIAGTLDRTQPIRVKSFFLPKDYIGIRQYPTTIEEVFAEMDSYDEEEREYFQRDIDQWDKSKQFVLEWHREYFIDQHGRVVSS